MRILIKVSGDAKESRAVREHIKFWARHDSAQVVLLVGGGTEISRQLVDAGYEVAFDEQYSPPRRIAPSYEEKCIIRGVLDDEVIDWKRSIGLLPNVEVISPFESFGGVLCNINGDDLVKAMCTEFDRTIVFTKADRKKNKEKIFKGFPVEVLTI